MTSTRQLPDTTNLMEELAQRCERASGPDRELDALIWAEIDGRDVCWHGNMLLGKSRRRPHDECRIGYIDPGQAQRNFSLSWSQPPIPEFTGSLDAAVTLVPDSKYWHVGHGRTRDNEPLGGASIIAPGSLDTIAEAEAPTAALALCAASLRARKGLE